MNISVRYYTRSGNTRKLAEAIAAAVGAEAADLQSDLTEKADLLFLGSSLYAGSFDPAVADFLTRNGKNIGKLVCFGSSASGRSTFEKVRKFASEQGISLAEAHFDCPGHFLFLHQDRPNDRDLAEAAAFAEKVCREEA